MSNNKLIKLRDGRFVSVTQFRDEKIPYDLTVAFMYEEHAEDVYTAMHKLGKHIQYNVEDNLARCICGCNQTVEEMNKEWAKLEKSYKECNEAAKRYGGSEAWAAYKADEIDNNINIGGNSNDRTN